jgi:hypothetical protein
LSPALIAASTCSLIACCSALLPDEAQRGLGWDVRTQAAIVGFLEPQQYLIHHDEFGGFVPTDHAHCAIPRPGRDRALHHEIVCEAGATAARKQQSAAQGQLRQSLHAPWTALKIASVGFREFLDDRSRRFSGPDVAAFGARSSLRRIARRAPPARLARQDQDKSQIF